MRELLRIYEDEGDKANIKKYREKIKLIEEAMEEERQIHLEETREEDRMLQQQESELLQPERIELEEDEEDDDGEGYPEEHSDVSDEKPRKPMVKRLGKKNH